MFHCRQLACHTAGSVVRRAGFPLWRRPLGIDCSLRLGLKALVHLAAWTAHHKDHLAQDRLEATHAFLSGTRRPGCLPVSSCRRSPVSATTSLDRIGVGIDTARYGHRVSFLRPDHQPAAKPLTVMENRAGYQALEERLK